MRTKKHKLSNVKLHEVSLVGKGDNPEAHVLLLKTKPQQICDFEKTYDADNKSSLLKQWYDDNIKTILKDSECTAEMFDEIIQDRKLRDQIWDLIWTLQDSIGSIIEDDSVTDKKKMTETTVGQFQSAVSTLFKERSNEDMKKTVEELEKALAEEVAKVAELEKKHAEEIEKAKAPNEDGTCKTCGAKLKKDAEIDKSALPEAVVKHMEEQEAINKANSAKIEKMEDEALTKSCVEKAASIPAAGASAELSDLLKSITKFSSDLADKVFGVLKTADARIKEAGLFKEAGDNSASTGATAYEKIVAKAAELRKADPSLSEAKAFTKVYESDSELRVAYNNER